MSKGKENYGTSSGMALFPIPSVGLVLLPTFS